MNNKILSIKNASAIFLVTVLILGTITALSSPSSFMVGAQAVPQYGMEREYGSYEQPEYGMDSYEKPSFRNDNYEQPEYYEQPREYPSYQPDYKPEYPSDNSYKSKKDSSSKSVSINKLNCINNNVNINGNNTGDINLGNSGSSATGSGTYQGYLGVDSSGENGEGYDNGYNKQKSKSFDCIINNNNINNNFRVGNATTPETITCEECFTENLSVEQLDNLTEFLSGISLGNLEGLCEQLSNETLTNQDRIFGVALILSEAGITDEDAYREILECLEDLGLITVIDSISRLSTGGLTPSFSSPPLIAQGTGDSSELTALEKVAKLKQQWLNLLP